FEQTDDSDTPDAIFPNNWFSTHLEMKLVLYPMKAENRRLERRREIIEWLGTRYTEMIDFSSFEKQGRYLEGTGSLVLDHLHRKAFAAVSDRTHQKLVLEWGRKMDFEIHLFSASDKNKNPIYHTNVVLALGHGFALAGLDAINSKGERDAVLSALSDTGRVIIELTTEQIHCFSANGLQLKNKFGNPVFVISKNGWEALSEEQKTIIRSMTEVITPSLTMTEQLGGGSARCMIAELF
ncbi:MAG: arginine deiminase-related protein, partial [Bacteroidota bacterium]